jgi:hypothetical protein
MCWGEPAELARGNKPTPGIRNDISLEDISRTKMLWLGFENNQRRLISREEWKFGAGEYNYNSGIRSAIAKGAAEFAPEEREVYGYYVPENSRSRGAQCFR